MYNESPSWTPRTARATSCATSFLAWSRSGWKSECARYEFFFDVIRESNPDVALVSLDADQAKRSS